MKKYSKMIIASLSLGLLSAAFVSAEVAVTSEDLFAKLDANLDGQISKVEAQEHKALSKLFDALDVDKNGLLSPSELMDSELH